MFFVARSSVIVPILLLDLIVRNQAAMTVDQMTDTVATFRSMCQPKFKISDDLANGLSNKSYPDDKDVKCYVNCVLEMMRVSKKGKMLYDATAKQISSVLPEHMRDTYMAALNACKEAGKGVKDNCDAAYAMMQCFFANNPMFIFP